MDAIKPDATDIAIYLTLALTHGPGHESVADGALVSLARMVEGRSVFIRAFGGLTSFHCLQMQIQTF